MEEPAPISEIHVDSSGDHVSDDGSIFLDGPQALVKKDTGALNVLRGVFSSFLLVSVVVLAFGIHRLSSSWEEEAFRQEFTMVASRFVDAFTAQVSETMWNANIIGTAITSNTEVIAELPRRTIPMFDQLTKKSIYVSRASRVFWSPLLKNDQERVEWNEYAKEQITGGINTDVYQCWPCGSKDIGVPEEDEDADVVTPLGTWTCANLDWAGRNGLIDETDCPILTILYRASCNCQPLDRPESHTLGASPRLNEIYEITSTNGGKNVTIAPRSTSEGPFSPVWQVSPSGDFADFGMYDLASSAEWGPAIQSMMRTKLITFSQPTDPQFTYVQETINADSSGWPKALIVSPVFAGTNGTDDIVGTIVTLFHFNIFLSGFVPVGSEGMIVVVDNSCADVLTHTYRSDGSTIHFVDYGDDHDTNFDDLMEASTFETYFDTQRSASVFQTVPVHDNKNCGYRVRVYASEEFRDQFLSNRPLLYAGTVLILFFVNTMIFYLYDTTVQRRNEKVMKVAMETNNIVSDLFPSAIRKRLFRRNKKRAMELRAHQQLASPQTLLQMMFGVRASTTPTKDDASPAEAQEQIIAEYYANVTVSFMDIHGFSPWSSEREPGMFWAYPLPTPADLSSVVGQIFRFLEAVYQEFDKIGARFGVFKVETSGDNYISCTGLGLGYDSVGQKKHAVRMARFAYEAVLHIQELTNSLEASLGPGTSTLSVRVGIASGPVTAGVLRGRGSRFQLFGDTMNVTSLMQSTGLHNRVHASDTTAQLLKDEGLSHWVTERDDLSTSSSSDIKTYWVHPTLSGSDDGQLDFSSLTWNRLNLTNLASKSERLIEWNTELLVLPLKKLVLQRKIQSKNRYRMRHAKSDYSFPEFQFPIDAVSDVLDMHDFNELEACSDPKSVNLGEDVTAQLKYFISVIASMYHDNPFHNWEHACHVAMSAGKIINRIIKPDNVHFNDSALKRSQGRVALARHIHNSTFGISSDALMQFAALFACVIHDVQHSGVSNQQLCHEHDALAIKYSNKCVAEQNSFQIAWDLLLEDRFTKLRKCICPTQGECTRFRDLVVNAVMATDIADKDLQARRRERWNLAFHSDPEAPPTVSSGLSVMSMQPDPLETNRKATIVFEYIIQASDVAHTMQHFKIYNEWNEKLFEERYVAYLDGREPKDPSIGWAQGELWFFDNYIIPLAKKLETCGVFGVSSDEYLNYALENRLQWERQGHDIVKLLVEKYGRKEAVELDVDPPMPPRAKAVLRKQPLERFEL